MLKYYQWIHLIILFQSLLFLLPRILWLEIFYSIFIFNIIKIISFFFLFLFERRSLNDKCGIEIVNYVDAAIKYETVDKFAEREKLMDFLSGHITSFINAKNIYKDKSKLAYVIKRYTSFIFFWTGKRFGNYLIILYTICKFLYLVNVFGQLFLMTRLLGISNYHSLGLEILSRMAMGHDMIANHYFPKVTHCDFKVS
jgi:innexin